jgi:hypothetical protein
LVFMVDLGFSWNQVRHITLASGPGLSGHPDEDVVAGISGIRA